LSNSHIPQQDLDVRVPDRQALLIEQKHEV